MKLGITLPQFRHDAELALSVAQEAETAGIDGVFAFDHLWPMGQPGRPALSMAPFLGALASATERIALGSLVARVGLLPTASMIATLTTVDTISGGRCIAGIGTGDSLSRAENEAFGLDFAPAEERRAELAEVGRALAGHGIPVWIGGGGPKTLDVARRISAAVNLWDAHPDRIAELVAQGVEVTWGGPVGTEIEAMADRLGAVAKAGATWAVVAWPERVEDVMAAAVRAGVTHS